MKGDLKRNKVYVNLKELPKTIYFMKQRSSRGLTWFNWIPKHDVLRVERSVLFDDHKSTLNSGQIHDFKYQK